jgi:catechol 2,3-dioxygenase-like lactoylglutathione lyase family enzyme
VTVGSWPAHLRVGALRVVRASARYDETIVFYRDVVGLPIVDEFDGSYGEDGSIFGMPGTETHLEIVRAQPPGPAIDAFDQLVFYLPDQAAVDDATQALLDHGVRPEAQQHPYWEANGGVTFRDPDGRALIFVNWVYGRDPQPSDAGH